MADSLSLSPVVRPLKILAGVTAAGVIQYLVAEALDHLKDVYGIESLLPIEREDLGSLEALYPKSRGAGLRNTTLLKITNRGRTRATVIVEQIEYSPNRTITLASFLLLPGQGRMLDVPDGSEGSVLVRSDGGTDYAFVARLSITDQHLNPRYSQLLRFSTSLRPASWDFQTVFYRAISTLVLRKGDRALIFPNIPSIVLEDRVLYDRNIVLSLIEKNGATDCVYLLKLEGRIVFRKPEHLYARRDVYGHGRQMQFDRLETTAAAVRVIV